MMENGCEAGCKIFTGGEVKHHPDCKYYAGSMSKMYDDLRSEVKKLRLQNETSTNHEVGNNADLLLSAVRLAETVVKVMDKKGKAGCNDPTWLGFENCNGTEIGVDIERMIKQAKRFLANYSNGSGCVGVN